MKWYQQPIWIIVLLILFFPVGLFLMWKYANWNSKAKWLITGVFAVLVVIAVITPPSETAKQESASKSEPKKVASLSAEEKATKEAEEAKRKAAEQRKKSISYEIIERWDINNGGEGKVIVIPREYLNETDMGYLGEKLKNDVKNDRNAFIHIYTSKEAAQVRDAVLNQTASEAEVALYDKNYVGVYTKNGNSGFHELTIYYDGILGTNTKTIKY